MLNNPHLLVFFVEKISLYIPICRDIFEKFVTRMVFVDLEMESYC